VAPVPRFPGTADGGELQERLADEATRAFVGRRLEVTVQERLGDDEGGGTVARSYREAPDTDGEIELVASDGIAVDLPAGRTLTVEVVDAVGVDLVARVDGGRHG
jgi:ribosomal protein S12 methylthiotransferase